MERAAAPPPGARGYCGSIEPTFAARVGGRGVSVLGGEQSSSLRRHRRQTRLDQTADGTRSSLRACAVSHLSGVSSQLVPLALAEHQPLFTHTHTHATKTQGQHTHTALLDLSDLQIHKPEPVFPVHVPVSVTGFPESTSAQARRELTSDCLLTVKHTCERKHTHLHLIVFPLPPCPWGFLPVRCARRLR